MTNNEIIKFMQSKQIPQCGDKVYRADEEYEAYQRAIDALDQQPYEDAISRKVIIQTLNKMDRYTASELTLCDTDKKFPANEVFIVDDVYEQITEHLPSVMQKSTECDDAVSRPTVVKFEGTNMACIGGDEIMKEFEPITPEEMQECKDIVKKYTPKQQPSDTVSRGVFEQVMWERDVAIGQLNELGYELGQKVEPCDDAISREYLKYR